MKCPECNLDTLSTDYCDKCGAEIKTSQKNNKKQKKFLTFIPTKWRVLIVIVIELFLAFIFFYNITKLIRYIRLDFYISPLHLILSVISFIIFAVILKIGTYWIKN